MDLNLLDLPARYKVKYVRLRLSLGRSCPDILFYNLLENFYNFSQFSSAKEKKIIQKFVNGISENTAKDRIYMSPHLTVEVKKILTAVYILALKTHDGAVVLCDNYSIVTILGRFYLTISESVRFIDTMICFYVLETTDDHLAEILQVKQLLRQLLFNKDGEKFNNIANYLVEIIQIHYDNNEAEVVKERLIGGNYDVAIYKDYINALSIFVDF